MSNLVLYTMRSGSTILSDIIAYADKSINLGEGLHSVARSYNYNPLHYKHTELYQNFSSYNLTSLYFNKITKNANYKGFFSGKQVRADLLKKSTQQWTAKELLEKFMFDISLVDYCVDNGINVYLTHRKDIIGQLISLLNARYREKLKIRGFFVTNKQKDDVIDYGEVKLTYDELRAEASILLQQLMLWRIVYDRYKTKIKIVSYEDVIQPMNFISLGISKEVVDAYNREETHLVPSPVRSEKIIIENDLPEQFPGIWEQTKFLFEQNKFLVEV